MRASRDAVEDAATAEAAGRRLRDRPNEWQLPEPRRRGMLVDVAQKRALPGDALFEGGGRIDELRGDPQRARAESLGAHDNRPGAADDGVTDSRVSRQDVSVRRLAEVDADKRLPSGVRGLERWRGPAEGTNLHVDSIDACVNGHDDELARLKGARVDVNANGVRRRLRGRLRRGERLP